MHKITIIKFKSLEIKVNECKQGGNLQKKAYQIHIVMLSQIEPKNFDEASKGKY